MMVGPDNMHPENQQAFASPKTQYTTVSDISDHLQSELQNQAKAFVSFSVATDESPDVINAAQLAVLVRGVD